MKLRGFLNVVPKAVRLWAWVVVGCALLIGLVAGYKNADPGDGLRMVLAGAGAGLVLGALLAIWLLCLGFVFADAQRRRMRAILWVLVAALFPHLLGFLLYFVIRQPIASTCAHCKQSVAPHQRFCPWCGTPQPSSSVGGDARVVTADGC